MYILPKPRETIKKQVSKQTTATKGRLHVTFPEVSQNCVCGRRGDPQSGMRVEIRISRGLPVKID
jgi:hypothetical protein